MLITHDAKLPDASDPSPHFRLLFLCRKVGALNLMKTIIGSLRGQVYDAMVDNGFFQDPTEVEVRQLFMPWLVICV